MIVKYPTGLYTRVLPKDTERGDVTFLISSQPPPRTDLLFPKIPPALALKRRQPRVIEVEVRRAQLDVLVYSTNSSSRTDRGSAGGAYEVGQVLEFTTAKEVRDLEPLLAGAATEIRHDTGLLDYNRLGITAQQRDVIEREGDKQFRLTQTELAAARSEYLDLQVQIAESQKALAESDKALEALRAIPGDGVTGIIAQLEEKRRALLADRGRLVNRAAAVADAAVMLQAAARKLAQVVR